MQRFQIQMVPPTKHEEKAIRQVKASKVGTLVSIKGMVTRVSDVKPLLSVATYSCGSCGYEIYQEVMARQFNPVSVCPSNECKTNRSSGHVTMQTKASKFVKYQEVKFQELPDQVVHFKVMIKIVHVDGC